MEIANTYNYNWGDLPTEIAAKIRGHLELYDDYVAFPEVCSSWRLAIKQFPGQYINRKHTQLPWLMLVDPNDSSYRRFYSLTKERYLKIDLPPFLSPPQTRRYFSSRGWLISLTRNVNKNIVGENFNISLFNPFSNNNETIHAPLFHLIEEEDTGDSSYWEDEFLLSFFGEIVVSTSPNNAKHDFVVAITFGDYRQVAYWRLGHGDSWIVPYSDPYFNRYLRDLCFFRGELYATQYNSPVCNVIAFGDLKDHKNSPRPRVVAKLEVPANMIGCDFDHYYLVESKYDQSDQAHASSLLVIHRCVLSDSLEEDIEEDIEEAKYNTASFNVFKLNFDKGNFEPVNSLGNQAIFVGQNCAFAVYVNVDDDRGCKADCIYFTDDTFELYIDKSQGGGSDMGIYSLPQGTTLPFYEGPSHFSVINPPIWIEFSNA